MLTKSQRRCGGYVHHEYATVRSVFSLARKRQRTGVTNVIR